MATTLSEALVAYNHDSEESAISLREADVKVSSKKAPAGSQLKSVSSSSRPHGFLNSSRATKTPSNSRLLAVLGPADAQADVLRTLSGTDMSCPVRKISDGRASRLRHVKPVAREGDLLQGSVVGARVLLAALALQRTSMLCIRHRRLSCAVALSP